MQATHRNCVSNNPTEELHLHVVVSSNTMTSLLQRNLIFLLPNLVQATHRHNVSKNPRKELHLHVVVPSNNIISLFHLAEKFWFFYNFNELLCKLHTDRIGFFITSRCYHTSYVTPHSYKNRNNVFPQLLPWLRRCVFNTRWKVVSFLMSPHNLHMLLCIFTKNNYKIHVV